MVWCSEGACLCLAEGRAGAEPIEDAVYTVWTRGGWFVRDRVGTGYCYLEESSALASQSEGTKGIHVFSTLETLSGLRFLAARAAVSPGRRGPDTMCMVMRRGSKHSIH